MGNLLVLHDPEEAFIHLEGEWEDLLRRCSGVTPFQSPIWHRLWWKYFGEGLKLYLLCLRGNNQKLLGIAPLALQDPSSIRNNKGPGFLLIGGEELSDYLDFIVEDGGESEFFLALHNYFMEFGDDRFRLTLRFVPDGSRTLQEDNLLLNGMDWTVSIRLEEVAPFLELSGTWEDYLMSLGGKERHEIRRKIGKAQRGLGAELELVGSGPELEDALDDFLRLHCLSHHQKAIFMTQRMEKFFREMVRALGERGMARLAFLRTIRGRISTALLLIYNRVVGLYNSGYDPTFSSYSPGITLIALTIKWSIEEGFECYDFLRGGEAYKFRFGAQEKPLYRVELRRRRD